MFIFVVRFFGFSKMVKINQIHDLFFFYSLIINNYKHKNGKIKV